MASKIPKRLSTELQDRMDDMNNGDTNVGNVRAQVIAAMDDAWAHLNAGGDNIGQAAISAQNAIDVLTFYQARVERLEHEEDLRMIARWEARKTA